MTITVNMLEAKTSLPELVRQVESGAQREIVIARAGRPAARLVPLAQPQADRSRRIGVARGRFEVPEPEPALDAAVEDLFETGGG
jgi:prevent-host-death family protein